MSFINVKDAAYAGGAVGNGVNDDTNAIQAAFDAAFKTGGVPNGTANWQSNRAVHFPSGNYKITSSLNLTQVYRGVIFGNKWVSLSWAGAAGQPMFNINGMQESRLEKFQFLGGYPNISGSGAIGMELDWDNSGSVQLRNNDIVEVIAANCSVGFRIANSGHDGANNNFFLSRAPQCGIGYHLVGAAATDNRLWSNSAGNNCTVGIQCDGGSFIAHGLSISTNSTAHIVVNSPTPCLAAGSRFEVGVCAQIASGATLRLAGIITDSGVIVNSGGLLIADGSTIKFGVTGTGNLKRRATEILGPGVNAGITVLENK